jgi:hypothetical protein
MIISIAMLNELRHGLDEQRMVKRECKTNWAGNGKELKGV